MLGNIVRIQQSSLATVLKLGIIVGVPIASYYFGIRASTDLLFRFVAIAGMLILIRQPELGLVALLAGNLSLSATLGTGSESPMPVTVLLIPASLVIWLAPMFLKHQLRIAPSPANLPIFVFALSVVLSFLASNLPWNFFAGRAPLSAQIGGVLIFMFSMLVFILAGNLIKDLRWLKVLTGILLAIGAVGVVTYRVAPSTMPFLATVLAKIFVLPWSVDGGSLFWLWTTALAGGLALFDRTLSAPTRFILICLAVSVPIAGYQFLRIWVSGWLPPMAALLVLVWLRSWRVGLAVVIIGILAIPVSHPEVIESVLALKQYSTDTRQLAAQIILSQVVPASPIIGLGPANYYFYTRLYPILGYYVKFNSHNQYVDIIAQLGIVGLAIFGWLMYSIGRFGWSLRERVGTGFARGYVYGCLGGLAGTLVASAQGDWFLPFVYNVGVAGLRASLLGWVFLGGLVAISQLARRDA